MRQVHRAGEKMFVDYAGQTVGVYDPASKQFREAQIFITVLGASSYTYAEATWTQTLPDWISSHCRAYEYIDGVPEVTVPDNLEGGVKDPCFYEPDINPTYFHMTRHYGTAVIPAQVAKPKDKATVYNGSNVLGDCVPENIAGKVLIEVVHASVLLFRITVSDKTSETD